MVQLLTQMTVYERHSILEDTVDHDIADIAVTAPSRPASTWHPEAATPETGPRTLIFARVCRCFLRIHTVVLAVTCSMPYIKRYEQMNFGHCRNTKKTS
jgi:hypothetical protein